MRNLILKARKRVDSKLQKVTLETIQHLNVKAANLNPETV